MRTVVVATLLLSTPVLAQEQAKDLKSEVERCASYEGDGDRLACFDFISGRKAVAAKPVDDTPKAKWDVSVTPSPLDKSNTTIAFLAADKSSVGKAYGPEAAALIIRCKEKKTAIYISFSTLVAYETVSVSYRAGDNQPKTAIWPASENQKAYGPFDTKGAIPFAKELLGAKDFYVRGETKVFGSSEASFTLDGIEEATAGIRRDCKW